MLLIHKDSEENQEVSLPGRMRAVKQKALCRSFARQKGCVLRKQLCQSCVCSRQAGQRVWRDALLFVYGMPGADCLCI